MSKIYFLVILLFFYFFSKIAISGNEVDHKLWVYEKVSGLDVFGKRDLNTINKLDAIYSKVTFTFSSKKLTIKNDFLKDNTLLKKQLPGTNKVDKFNDAMVSYEWQVSNLLKISVIKDNESATFSFNEHSTGTSLDVTEETQY
ncbi:hypothetical protein ACETTA_21425 [Enterobacter cloacae]|uniref:hypothetical protein n=1 Tax=Enterobacter cloacae TaxID=550 RepID=UPI0035A6E977